MHRLSYKDFRQSLDKVLLDISHPLMVIITFLLSPIIVTGDRTFMAVHIVKGLNNFEIYAILAVVGLLHIIISYVLYWRIFTATSSRLNMIGGLCLLIAFKIAQVSDEGNGISKISTSVLQLLLSCFP